MPKSFKTRITLKLILNKSSYKMNNNMKNLTKLSINKLMTDTWINKNKKV